MIQPRVQDYNRQQLNLFNEVKKHMKIGMIPAGMVNPSLIAYHNDNSPKVAHITHPQQEVSLDALAVLYCDDIAGLKSRRLFTDILREESTHTVVDVLDNEDMRSYSRSDRVMIQSE
jgi:hypothetical protein